MRVLITGGGGFLGSAVVRMLLQRGDEVRTFQRGSYPELERLGAEVLRGDLADPRAVARAAEGTSVVIHAAARAGVWGPASEYHRANVTGTRHVIEACLLSGVPRLVYTSSPSVVFDGRDAEGIDERTPRSRRFLGHYPRTKARAEELVLAANGPSLATVALRPHLIWGPGDPHLVPRIVERARAGRLRLVGDGRNLVDSTYIENAALAHVLAADRLAPGAACAGKVYFVSNGEPLAMADLVNGILRAARLPPVRRSISPRAAYALGAALELAHAVLRLRREPRLTRFVALQLSRSHWFDIAAARRDLGYQPRVSVAEGLERLAAALLAPGPGRDPP